jgi:SNF2 family DNA or RNA helicase
VTAELTLHDYQQRAIEFAVAKKNPFFALDMGLGKTIIALKTVEQLGIPAIVIAPINPMYSTWPAEIKKWNLSLTYDILHGPHKTEIFNTSKADVLLLNFHGIKWFMQEVAKQRARWVKRMLILDESSMIKSPTTQRFKMLKKMRPLWHNYRMCLSATPSPNGYHELWSQYYMLDYGKTLFDSYYKYRGTYFNYSGPPLFKTTLRSGSYETIKNRVKPITYRLKAEDYLEMPDYIHNEIRLQLSPKLFREYKKLEDEFLLEFSETSATAYNAGALSMKLRQFIQGAVYTDAGNGEFYPLHTVKIDALKELMESSAGQPILCPIQFKFERKMINAFTKQEIPCIAGGTSTTDARRYIKQWNDGSIPLLLCHPASLGHGVNLQSGGHIVLWFGLTWSLEHYKQLNGRIYRQGQKNAVVINHFIMENTVDERVINVLKQKDASQERLLNALRR